MARAGRESGFLLVGALLVLVGILVISQLGISRSLTEQMAANVSAGHGQLLHIAEAGIDAAIGELGQAPGTRFASAPWSALDAAHPVCAELGAPCRSADLDIGIGTAHVIVARSDTNAPVVRVSADLDPGSLVAGMQGDLALEAVLEAVAPTGYPYGLFANADTGTTVSARYGATIDSWNSGDAVSGDYLANPPNHASPLTWNAPIRTNSSYTASRRAVDFGSASTLYGSIAVGPGVGVPTTAITADLARMHTTSIQSLPRMRPPVVAMPSGSPCPIGTCPVLNVSASDGICNGTAVTKSLSVEDLNTYSAISIDPNCELAVTGSGELWVNRLTLSNTSVLSFRHNGPIAMMVDGPIVASGPWNEIVLYGTSSVQLPPKVQMYVNGDITFGANSAVTLFNGHSAATRFTLNVAGERDVTFESSTNAPSATFVGVIYAPESTVRFGSSSALGPGTFNGAIIANDVKFNWQWLHYDQAVNPENTPTAMLWTVRVRLWRQLS